MIYLIAACFVIVGIWLGILSYCVIELYISKENKNVLPKR